MEQVIRRADSHGRADEKGNCMNATPWGFRDILPEEALLREEIAYCVRTQLAAAGYLPVETPLLEDPSALTAAGRIADTPFKLFDDDGRLLVVRPDNTLPIVRLVSTRLAEAKMPFRLRYEAPVVRAQQRNAGAARQFTQLGFELIGVSGATGDAELISTVTSVLEGLGLSSWTVVCGSVRPFLALLELVDDEELAREMLALVHANNLVDLDACVREHDLPETLARAVVELPRLYGGAEVLDKVDELAGAAGAAPSVTSELRELVALVAATTSAALTFDFSVMNSFDYYTGLVIKVYAGDLSDPVGTGGRYDTAFDGVLPGCAHVPAAGFAFSLERLEAARQVELAPGEANADHAVARGAGEALRIAVPKGSLSEGTIAALGAVGLDVSGLRHPGRRLIVRARDTVGSIGDVEFVIVRATDAPAFVASGGADCGFCGRDSLIEANLDLLELIDMRYGACRFIEAEPAGRAGMVERSYARRGCLRVATKYPRIASTWYERRGIAADIIALHGNIELGPIVGMTDRIVDITATGATLRENNLVITGELMACTARFFVNPGRARLDSRVRSLTERLSSYVQALDEGHAERP